MRHVVASLLVASSLAVSATAQSRGAAGKPAIGACSLLPRDLVAKVSTVNKQILDIVKPMEEPVGASGSACHYGGITLQIDPFTPARLEELHQQNGKDWVVTPGVGDAAYFRDNRGEYAELYARAGTHVFTIQMDVPDGGTVAKIKPNVITLANEIAPKLR